MRKIVRQAKKDNLIQKYSVDQNGKIYVINNGDNSYKEVKSIADIEKLRDGS